MPDKSRTHRKGRSGARRGRTLREKKQLIAAYLRLKKALGRIPTVTEYYNVVGSVSFRLDAFFGRPGWRNMLREIGDRPGQWTRGKLDREHLLNDYLKLKKKLRRQPTYRDFYKFTGHGDSTIARHFGKPAWRTMLKTVGDRPRFPYRPDKSDRKACIDEYLRLKKDLAKQPSQKEYYKHTRHTQHMLDRVFGRPGWSRLVKMAGDTIKQDGRPRIDCNHLIDDFKWLKKSLRKTPTYREFVVHTRHYLPVLIRCFGRPGWIGLVRAAENKG